ncbi:MAG: ABC transporter permease, partial [Clostridia bacterium]|nr:ABC transporter permease [Clostridia bacterium]
MDIMKLLNALPGAISQGVIWGMMAIGVYLTYRILEVSDLTVDGSIATGGAVAAMMIPLQPAFMQAFPGIPVWVLSMVILLTAFAVGALTGL